LENGIKKNETDDKYKIFFHSDPPQSEIISFIYAQTLQKVSKNP